MSASSTSGGTRSLLPSRKGATMKMSANSPCPCGSGLKIKKCACKKMERADGRFEPVLVNAAPVNPATIPHIKLGPNALCPCGSGAKVKRCRCKDEADTDRTDPISLAAVPWPVWAIIAIVLLLARYFDILWLVAPVVGVIVFVVLIALILFNYCFSPKSSRGRSKPNKRPQPQAEPTVPVPPRTESCTTDEKCKPSIPRSRKLEPPVKAISIREFGAGLVLLVALYLLNLITLFYILGGVIIAYFVGVAILRIMSWLNPSIREQEQEYMKLTVEERHVHERAHVLLMRESHITQESQWTCLSWNPSCICGELRCPRRLQHDSVAGTMVWTFCCYWVYRILRTVAIDFRTGGRASQSFGWGEHRYWLSEMDANFIHFLELLFSITLNEFGCFMGLWAFLYLLLTPTDDMILRRVDEQRALKAENFPHISSKSRSKTNSSISEAHAADVQDRRPADARVGEDDESAAEARNNDLQSLFKHKSNLGQRRPPSKSPLDVGVHIRARLDPKMTTSTMRDMDELARQNNEQLRLAPPGQRPGDREARDFYLYCAACGAVLLGVVAYYAISSNAPTTCADKSVTGVNLFGRPASCSELSQYCSGDHMSAVIRANCPITCNSCSETSVQREAAACVDESPTGFDLGNSPASCAELVAWCSSVATNNAGRSIASVCCASCRDRRNSAGVPVAEAQADSPAICADKPAAFTGVHLYGRPASCVELSSYCKGDHMSDVIQTNCPITCDSCPMQPPDRQGTENNNSQKKSSKKNRKKKKKKRQNTD